MTFREIVQFVSRPKQYVSQVYNIVDLIQITLLSITVDSLINDQTLDTNYEENVVLISAFFLWMELLFVIGNFFYVIAIFNAAMIRVSCLYENTTFLVLLVCEVAFVQYRL